MYSEQTISELRKKREWYLEQISHIDAILSTTGEYKNTKQTIIINSSKCPYDPNDSNQMKFAAILKQRNVFSNISSMAVDMNKYEPNKSVDEAKKVLATAKNILLKSSSIVKYQPDSNNMNSFYGSPAWMDENGVPKKEYMYDESELHQKKAIKI